MKTSMEKWEYCSITLGWPSGLGTKNYKLFINYYSPDSGMSTEERDTHTNAHPSRAIHAIGEGLAYLGQKGWIAVSIATRLGDTKWEAEAVLRKQIFP
jgi:hypothetical protein